MARTKNLLRVLCLTVLLAGCESSAERADEHYQNALALIAEGDDQRAIVELRNVFRFDGNHREARLLIAETHRRNGNSQQSYSQYLRLVEQYPEDLESRVALSELAFQSANWDELNRHGAKAAELSPEDPRVQIISVVLDYRAAILAEDKVAQQTVTDSALARIGAHPDSILLREVIIDGYLRTAQFGKALEQLDINIAQLPDVRKYWQQRLQVLIQMGDEDATEAQLIEMIERFPEDSEQKATLVRYYLSRDRVDSVEEFLRKLVADAEEDDIAPRVDLVRFLLERRSVDEGLAELEKAAATESNPAPFILLKAGIDFSRGERDEAITSLETILQTAEPSEQTNRIKVALAKMLLDTGNEVGARSLVEMVLAEEPSQVDAQKMNARWLIDADDPDAAIAGLRTALDSDSNDAEALTLMAEANTRKGSGNLASDFLALAVEASGNAPAETIRYAQLLIAEERYLPAEDILLDALRLNPGNVDLLTLTADLYLAMEDFGRTNQVINTLQQIDSPEAEQAAIAIELRRLERESGTQEAVAFLADIASQEDASFGSQVALIRAQLGTGDTDSAVRMAETLHDENPELPAAKLVLAMTVSSIGEFERAETLYRAVVEELPSEGAVWLELSRIKMRQGDIDGGVATIEEALAVNPDNPQLLWAQASYLERDGDFDAAIAVYEKLYAANSSSVIIANNLASMLTTYRDDSDSLDRAWNIARRFKDNTNPAVQDTYGWITHRRGDSEEAITYLESAALNLSNDAVVQFHFAEALLALDRKEEAIEQYRKVLEIAGGTDTRAQIGIARDQLTSLEAETAAE